MVKLGLEPGDCRLGRTAQRVAIFPFHHGPGLEDVWQRRRHMADLVACCLAVPAIDRRVKQGARRVGQADGLIQRTFKRGRGGSQPQKPVDRHPQRRRRLGHHLGVGQPGARGQQGRQG